jgi:SAM-dependent methyltransferase
MNVRDLKRRLAPLLRTPLHPQWLLRTGPGFPLHDLTGAVLDVGCADRRIEALLQPGSSYVGLDYPPTADNLYRTQPDVYGDAQALPFVEGSFDVVLLLHVLEHVPDPSAAMAEALRVLRPAGRLIVETPFLYPVHDTPFDYQRWTSVGLRRLVESQGGVVHRLDAAGTPAETGAVVFNLGLSVVALNWIRRRSPWLVLAPVLGLIIPVVNVVGWLLGQLGTDRTTMPHRIRLLCHKAGQGGT